MKSTGSLLFLIALPVFALIGVFAIHHFTDDQRASHFYPSPSQASTVTTPALDQPLHVVDVPDDALSIAAVHDPNYLLVGTGIPETIFVNHMPINPPGHLIVIDTRTWKITKRLTLPDAIFGLGSSEATNEVSVLQSQLTTLGTNYTLPDLKPVRPTIKHPQVGIENVSFDNRTVQISWAIVPVKHGGSMSSFLPAAYRSYSFPPVLTDTLTVSQDRKLIAVAGSVVTNFNTDAEVSYLYIVDCATGKNLINEPTQVQGVLAFVPRQNQLASIGGDQMLHVWDSHSGRQLWSSQVADGMFDFVTASPDGSEILAADSSHFVVWDTLTRSRVADIANASEYDSNGQRFRQRICFTADSKYIVVGDQGHVQIYAAPVINAVAPSTAS